MKYLLDTHIILWTLAGSDKLPLKAREIIEDPRNAIYYSTVSPWETEIKHLKEPERITISGKQLSFLCDQVGFLNLSITNQHINELVNVIPSEATKHKDPFDRMLLAQARAENMILLTHDARFRLYDDPHLMVL